ncbi:MAG: glycoside hydrolase family 127 protein [Verrucomicrobia bacterium]|nr:glycoside hydrolase family 127 protein [Verrucomicrobiota bacterium]
MTPVNPPGIKRRSFLANLTAGAATLAVSPAAVTAAAPVPTSGPSATGGLAEPAFRPLPLGAITPLGWLQRQLRLQADGLSGHLDEFWPDVGQSQWFGGRAEGWERAPYWLDGVIPLAWLLDDAPLKAKVQRYVRQIIAGQRPDGWYAPYPADASAKAYDLWAILLANKVLVQFHEATRDDAVLQAVLRNLRATLDTLDRTPLFDWGKFRWFEGLISTFYAYEQTGHPWLLDLARKLRDQGFDYRAYYAGQDITAPTPRRGLWTWQKHVVNTGMALKAQALAWRLTRHPDDLAFPARMLDLLDRYHGQATGMFTGDESLSGRNPVQGTELCAVVETLYSVEHLMAVTGEAAYGDRLERIAFNALPATFAPDMWSHQYDQQVNQVQCTINPDHMWSTNGPESNIFGLEPNYGCCTANMHQGWPKFAAHLWMRTPDHGLAAVAYAPSEARFNSQGVPVHIRLETDYPFRDTLEFTVTVDQPVRFPLLLRIPNWTRQPAITVAGRTTAGLKPGSFHRVDREWKGRETLKLQLPMHPATSRRYHQAISLERGPLLYSLKLGENWTRVNADKPHRELPHGDFEVRPTTPWNYALLVDESQPARSVQFTEQPVGQIPFSPEGAGVVAKAKGRRLPSWKLQHGWADEIAPLDPKTTEPLEDLTLIPYGCTNIRVTEFPPLKS